MKPRAVPLVRAAAELALTYRAAMDAVLRKDLKGWQDDRRRWWVDAEDLRNAVERRRQLAATDISSLEP
jgi:hypothetical protein